MPTPYIVPLGFIDQPTEDGSTFTLTNREESRTMAIGTPVTVWRYSPEQLAVAKIRGVISAVGHVTATFRIIECQTDPRWPENEQLMREKTPVYLALEGTFEPDHGRMLTQEQADTMQNVGPEYRKLRSGDPRDRGLGDDPGQDQ